MTETVNFSNSSWQMSVILQIVKSPFLNEKSSDFDEMWYTAVHLELDDNWMTKYEHF